MRSPRLHPHTKRFALVGFGKLTRGAVVTHCVGYCSGDTSCREKELVARTVPYVLLQYTHDHERRPAILFCFALWDRCCQVDTTLNAWKFRLPEDAVVLVVLESYMYNYAFDFHLHIQWSHPSTHQSTTCTHPLVNHSSICPSIHWSSLQPVTHPFILA